MPTADLVEREPQLRAGLSGSDLAEGALSAIEQEDLPRTSSLESLLGRMSWPEAVAGVALAVERIVVPPEAERDLPETRRRPWTCSPRTRTGATCASWSPCCATGAAAASCASGT